VNHSRDRWRQAELQEVCEIILGQSPPGDTYNTEGDGMPFFQGKAEFGDMYPSPRKWCSAPAKVAQADDILLSVRAPVGPTNLCPTESCIGRGLAAIRPLGNLPAKYVLYAIRATVAELAAKGTGSTFEAVSGADVRSHVINLAPQDQQLGIVVEIETQLSRLDAGIEALKRAQANLKRYRAAVLKAACEGRLVTTESARGSAQDEAPQVLLGDLIVNIGQGWSPKCDLNRVPEPDEWCVVTTTAVQPMKYLDNQGKALPSNVRPRPHLEIAAGDFLMTRKGPRVRAGVTCLVRTTRQRLMLCDTVYRFHCRKDRISPSYLEMALNSPSVTAAINSLKSGINESGVSLTHGKLNSVPIPLPPLAEQGRIVAEVERRLSVADALEASLATQLTRATRLRQSILQAAFNNPKETEQ
jgi:type I restriction enzyme S subunit